jgi:hypothetical protein
VYNDKFFKNKELIKMTSKLIILITLIFFNFIGCGKTKTNNIKDNNISNYSNNFIRNNDQEIIIDKRLNKIWQDNKEVIKINKNYNQAINYFRSLTLGNYNDWYLPKFDDMISMLNIKTKRIDGAFKYINPDIVKYWVSDIIDYDTKYYRPRFALFVAGDFHIFSGIKEFFVSVRCIRDINKGI